MKRVSVFGAAALVAAALLVATVGVTVGTAVAAAPVKQSAVAAAINPWSSFFMMRSMWPYAGISAEPDGSVVLAPASDSDFKQRWNAVDDAERHLVGAKPLVSDGSGVPGRCLEVDPLNPLAQNAKLVVSPCVSGSWTQAWLLAWDPANRQQFQLVNYYSLMAVTVVSVAGKLGLVQQPLRPGAREQKFMINNCVQCG